MVDERARAEMTAVLDGVQQQLHSIARIRQERARLTASATVRKRVTVTVNADGTVIETKFADGIEDLTHAEIARAITEAAQRATAEITRTMRELMEPLRQQRARLPKLSDLIEGMPDLSAELPGPPEVSTAPPGAAERLHTDPTEDAARGRGVTDAGW